MRRVTSALAIALALGCGRGGVTTVEAELRGDLPTAALNESYLAFIDVLPRSARLPIVDLVEGRLPVGLDLRVTDQGRIQLAGTPLEEGRFGFSIDVRVTTPRVQDLSASFSVDVVRDIPTEPLRLATTTLPPGTLFELYEGQIEAAGGAPPYVFLLDGAAPEGLGLEPSGLIRGRPRQFGLNRFQVRVTDELGQSQSGQVSLQIESRTVPMVILTPFPKARIARSYSHRLVGQGSTGGPYQWRLIRGLFPPGLDLRLRRGTSTDLTGIPREVGSFDFELELEDESGVSGQTSLSMEVVGPLGVNEALETARFRVPYRAVIELQNALAPVLVQLEGGALPDNTRLVQESDTVWSLVGEPRAIGVFRFTLRIADREDVIAASFIVRVSPG